MQKHVNARYCNSGGLKYYNTMHPLAVFGYAMLPIFDEYMFDVKTGYGSL